MQTERRFFSSELRVAGEGSKKFLTGHAAVYDTKSQNLGGFVETIARGAFDDVLKQPALDVICTINHNPAQLLGRTSSGTLELSSDSKGLAYRNLLPDTGYSNDLVSLAARRDLRESSFQFSLDTGDDAWGFATDPSTGKKTALRTINRVGHLYDVSIVATPAYSGTDASLSNRDWPTSMPAEIRAVILGRAAPTNMPTCECPCPACADEGDCANCDPEQCDDPACAKMHSDEGARAAHRRRRLLLAESDF